MVLLLTATFLQSAYVLKLYRALRSSPAPPAPQQLPGLSILLCAHNEGAQLEETLDHLLAQEHPDLEILVIDDCSGDETAGILARRSAADARLRSLRIAHKTRPGKKEALALGISQARHPYILLTDADCRPASVHWAAQMQAAMPAPAGQSEPAPALVLGYAPYRRHPGLLNAFIRHETLFTALQYLGWAASGHPYMGVGRNIAYTRNWLRADPSSSWQGELASGDDDLLVQALAQPGTTRLQIHPDSWVYSEPERTLPDYLRQKSRHLSTAGSYARGDQWRLLIYPLLQGMAFVCLILLFLGGYWLLLLKACLLRWLMLALAWRLPLQSFRERRLLPFLPLLDLLWSGYYLFTVFRLIFPRQKHW